MIPNGSAIRQRENMHRKRLLWSFATKVKHRCSQNIAFVLLYVHMPDLSSRHCALPPQVVYSMERLGENLKIARKRRKESLRSWASRLDVSVPTLQRMERGDPTVAMGTYATALWLIEKESVLYKHTEVDNDSYVLALEVQKAMARHTRKKRNPP